MPDATDPARQRRTAAMTVMGATRRTAARGGGGRPRSRPPHAGQTGQAMQRPTGCPGAPATLTAKAACPTTTKQNPLPRADGNGTPTANRLAPTTAPRGGEGCASHRRVRRRPHAGGAQNMGVPPRREKGVGEAARHWLPPPARRRLAAGRWRSRRDGGAGRRAGPAWPCVRGRLTLLYCPARRRQGGSRQTATVVCHSAAVVQWHASTRFTVMGF